jgi:ribose transport system permease protein
VHKISPFKVFLRDKSAVLLITLIVLTLATMVISSGVLEGEPFSALFNKGFMSKGNLINVFNNLVLQIVMLSGITLVLIGGNIDLSVAAQASLGTMIFAWLLDRTPVSWPFAFIICLAVGVIFGLINTFLVNKLKFPSFIATIGMASVYTGLCNVMTKGYNIQLAASGFTVLGRTSLFNFLPVTFLFAVAVLVVSQFILSRTTFGRNVYMLGGNPLAARLSGLNADRIRMLLFVYSSVFAVVSGLLWTAQLRVAHPTAIISFNPNLTVIAAAILGGVSFMGGAGNLGGAFIALLLLNVIENMLTVMGVQPYYNIFAQGLLLAIALIIDYFSAERRRKALLRIGHGGISSHSSQTTKAAAG